MISPITTCVCCLLSYRCAPLRRVWLHLFCLWLRSLDSNKVAKQSKPTSFHLYSCVLCSSPWTSSWLFIGPAPACQSFLYWGDQNWAQHSWGSLKNAQQRGRSTSLNLQLNLLAVLLQPECGQLPVLQGHADDLCSTCCPLGTPGSFPQSLRNAVRYVDTSCVTSLFLRTCFISKQRQSQRDTDTQGREYYLPDVNLK